MANKRKAGKKSDECLTRCIVKRKGHLEHYEERKVYASVYAAALNCHYSEKKSKKIAKQVARKITLWLDGKKHITSNHIRKEIIKNIGDSDVKLMYEHHLDLS